MISLCIYNKPFSHHSLICSYEKKFLPLTREFFLNPKKWWYNYGSENEMFHTLLGSDLPQFGQCPLTHNSSTLQ